MSRIEDALRRAHQHTRTAGSLAYDETEIVDPIGPVNQAFASVEYDSELAAETEPAEQPAESFGGEYLAEPPSPEGPLSPAADAVPSGAVDPPVSVAAPAPAPVAAATPVESPSAVPAAAPGPEVAATDTRASAVDEKLIISDEVGPQLVEQYRKIAAELHHHQSQRAIKVVMVASATSGEGKTLTAANVALTLAESFNRRVLLIDADLRRPSIHQLFRFGEGRGLSDGLQATTDEKLSIVPVSPRLSILPAGAPNPDPLAGLSSDRMRRIVEDASATFDWVVIDTPPIALLPDANLLATMADAIIFVVAAGSTPFALVQRALKALDRGRIVGVVLNRAVQQAAGDYYYHYYGGTDRTRRGQ
jgi:capsular exopolysaccharide synthesis family protein